MALISAWMISRGNRYSGTPSTSIPPAKFCASNTVGANPISASSCAQDNPAGPAPTIATLRPPVDLALENGEQLGDVVGVGGARPGKAGRPRAGSPAERRHLETGVIGDGGLSGCCDECDGLETGVVLEALPRLFDRADALRTSNELDQIIELLVQNGP